MLEFRLLTVDGEKPTDKAAGTHGPTGVSPAQAIILNSDFSFQIPDMIYQILFNLEDTFKFFEEENDDFL